MQFHCLMQTIWYRQPVNKSLKLVLLGLVSLLSFKGQVFTSVAQPVIFTNTTYHLGSFPQCVAAGDINGDGKPEKL